MDYGQTQDASVEWAKTARYIGFGLIIMAGFLIAYLIGGIPWMKWYGIGLAVMLILGSIFGGFYAITALMARRDESMAKAFGDLLYAHSQSGAQMSKAITEVVRGANQMNKADADVQMKILNTTADVGKQYERRIADLVYKNQMQLQQQSYNLIEDHGSEPEEEQFSYMIPDNSGPAYMLPEIN